MHRTRRYAIAAALAALAVIAGACGSSGDDDGADDAATEAAYLDSVATITTENNTTIEAAFDAAFADTEGLALETTLPLLADALDAVIAAQEEAIERYRRLDVPAGYADDHGLGIQFLEDQIDAWTRQRDAAEAGDGELAVQIDLDLRSLSRNLLAVLSPEFAASLTAFDEGFAFADLFGDLDAAETAYLDAVAEGWDEFGRRNRRFSAALTQSYGSDELLLAALLEAGAGQAFAAVRDVIVEIEPPPSFTDGHARLLAYLDETVALDTDIGEAARNGDVVGFEVANYGLALAGARFSLEAPAPIAAIIGDPVDLVAPADLPGEAFGEELWQALQRFRLLALRTQIESGVFPVVSDENLAAAMAAITPTVIDLTQQTVAELEALAPSAEFAPGVDRLLAYLGELIGLRESVLEAASAGDLETLRTYGELGGVAADRAETELWCAARADLADDPIEPITATFFRAFGPGTVAELCPEA